MTRIIPISQIDYSTSHSLCHAAWQFSRAVLWAEQSFSEDEQRRSLLFIKTYLNFPEIIEGSFNEFCERILLAHEAIYLERSVYLPQPSVWFHPNYQDGYITTKMQHRYLSQRRMDVPGYRQEYNVLVTGFFRYSNQNKPSYINSCRRHLIKLKAFDLLPLLYRSVIYSKFLQS